MKKRRFSRSVRFLLFVPILMVLLLVANGAPGQIQAQQERDYSACWTSGPISLGEIDLAPDTNQWGENDDEFVVDQRDLGDVARFTMKLYPDYLKGDHEWVESGLTEPDGLSKAESDEWEDSQKVYTLFDSVPELVDYAFAMDFFYTGDDPYPDRDIYDRRVRLLAMKIAGHTAYVFGEDEDHRMLLPWQGDDAKKNYLERRSTGAYYNAVKSLSTEWIDPSNPGGGRAVDSVALAQDQVANDMELLEGTITMAGDGGVSHYGTTEGIGQQVLFETRSDCGTGGSCSETSTYSNNPVPIVLHTNAYEQNDGQIDRNTTVKDERRILVKDGTPDAEGNDVFVEVEYEFDPAENSPSSTLSRDAGQGGYSRMHQEDTNSDELRISLVLKDKYRKDIEDYDPDKGNIFASRGLPAMGTEPWTYGRFEKGRHHSLNDWRPGRGVGTYRVPPVEHLGYRQPGLDLPVWETLPTLIPEETGLAKMNSGLANRWDPKHIKWPVNFEDLNWYLYKLPGQYRESLWLYWLTPGGSERLVFSGYGEDAFRFPVDGTVYVDDRLPVCTLPRNREHDEDEVRPPPLNVGKIVCEAEGGDTAVVDWNFINLRKGKQPGVHFPFDTSDSVSENHLLGPHLMVKQGVERAVDVDGPRGTRKLSRFDFSILESQPMGESPPEEDGYLAERFYGVPQNSDERDGYLAEWKSDPINPNMPYLMVFTFYEARQEGDLKFKIGPNEEDHGEVFQLPKRQIRRVICRAIIHPSGLNPSAGESKGWFTRMVDGVKSFFSDTLLSMVGGWLSGLLAAIANVAGQLGIRTAELVCSGLGKLDDLTALGNVSGPAPQALVDKEGRIRVNAAVKSKLEGSKRCHRISSPPVSTCERDADQILKGKCVRLPEFRLNVRTAEFIRPLNPKVAVIFTPEPNIYDMTPASIVSYPNPLVYDEYRVEVPVGSYYAKHGDPGFVSIVNAVDFSEDADEMYPAKPRFQPVADLTSDPPEELNNRNRGLTRVYLDWDLRWDTISTDFYDSVDGFAVILHPDQKSVSYPVPEKGLPPFYLPKWIYSEIPMRNSLAVDRLMHSRVEGFAVGGLNYYPRLPGYIAGFGSTKKILAPLSWASSRIWLYWRTKAFRASSLAFRRRFLGRFSTKPNRWR